MSRYHTSYNASACRYAFRTWLDTDWRAIAASMSNMVASASPFVKSSLDVGLNAVKSILFRTASILLQFAVYKVFALVASKKKAFMPYLMFSENAVQQVMFIAYNFVRVNGFLVLGFVSFFALAGVFDTFLWFLDAPGFVARPSRVNGRTMVQKLLPEPPYVAAYAGGFGNVSAVDAQIENIVSSNLFEPGANISLTTEARRGRPEVVAPTRDIADAGARIWLDDEGFSVSANTRLAYTTRTSNLRRASDCQMKGVNSTVVGWQCTYNNSDAAAVMEGPTDLHPEIHWDDETDRHLQWKYLLPLRDTNPWEGLSTGGGTVYMRQLFTLTKGRRRHTFLHTVFKVSMATRAHDDPAVSIEAEYLALLKRWWMPEMVEQQSHIIADLARNMAVSRAHNLSFSQGGAVASPHSVLQEHVELMNPSVDGKQAFTMVRLSSVNITLVRSETLAAEVRPSNDCDFYYMNIALGGKPWGTDCVAGFSFGDQTNHRFLGQVDTAAVLILNGLFALAGTNSSAKALHAGAYEWLRRNDARLANLVMARGYLVAIDPSLVTLTVTNMRPAMSFLQVLLVVLAAVAALLSYVAVAIFAKKHYTVSLLANLVATTTDERQPKSSQKPRYLWRVPDINLATQGARVLMGTTAGLYRLDRTAAGGDAEQQDQGIVGKQD